MKKLLLLVLLLFSITTIYSQARMGYTLENIKNEFNGPEENFEINFTNEGLKFASITTPETYVFYYFNESDICISSIILPRNVKVLNNIVRKYNNEYIIISNTEWKIYYSNGIIRIKLIFDDELEYAFIWDFIN